jgi:hypothetical protein
VNTALHAQKILDAWERPNLQKFEAELDSALLNCQGSSPASELESEQRALLETIVQHLRTISAQKPESGSPGTEAGLALLRHLGGRTANSFPYFHGTALRLV